MKRENVFKTLLSRALTGCFAAGSDVLEDLKCTSLLLWIILSWFSITFSIQDWNVKCVDAEVSGKLCCNNDSLEYTFNDNSSRHPFLIMRGDESHHSTTIKLYHLTGSETSQEFQEEPGTRNQAGVPDPSILHSSINVYMV